MKKARIEPSSKRYVEKFGEKIDILVNNASAISLTPTLDTPMKRFDLMWSVNARGTFLCSQACLPHLKQAENPHILVMSPPLSMNPQWFKDHLAYTLSKYGMSEIVLAWPKSSARTRSRSTRCGPGR